MIKRKNNKIEKLIKYLCPKGVEFKELGKVCVFQKGNSLSKADKGLGDIPIILYGELYTTYDNYITSIISSTSEERAQAATIASRGDLLLPISSTTKEAKIGKASTICVDSPVYIGGDTLILKHQQCAGYLVHLINSSWFEKQKMMCVHGTTIMHLHPKELAAIHIPIPPLAVQEEIVRILDKFTELEAELEARKKQYEWYRDRLLSFDSSHPFTQEVRSLALEDVLTIKNGRDWKNLPCGDIPVYGSGGIMGFVNKSIYSGPTVLIPRKGSLDKLYFVDKPFWNVDTVFYTEINDNIVFPKYVFYCLQKAHLEQLNKAGGVPSLTQSTLNKVRIPVPPIEDQQRIVAILDRLDALCNDITTGLPAEITARRKQYEYYRDKLLSFEEVA